MLRERRSASFDASDDVRRVARSADALSLSAGNSA